MSRRLYFFVLSGHAASPTIRRLPLAESQPAPHAYGDPYLLAQKQPHNYIFIYDQTRTQGRKLRGTGGRVPPEFVVGGR